MKIFTRYRTSILTGFAAVTCLILAGCSDIDDFEEFEGFDEEKENSAQILKTTQVRLENGSKNIVLETLLTQDIDDIRFDSDSVTIKCEERDIYGRTARNRNTQPVVSSIKRTASNLVSDNHIFLDVLVDLTLPEEDVAAEKRALLRLREIFSVENMRAVFLTGDGTTEALPASDYVIDAYCNPEKDSACKMLYKAMMECIMAASDTTVCEFQDTKRVLIVFSDGKVYSDNKPIDSEHFNHQEELINLCSALGPDVTLYYVQCNSMGGRSDSEAFIRNLCKSAGGLYQDAFSCSQIEQYMFKQFNIGYSDYTIVLTNPDNKIYNGITRILNLQFLKNNELLTELTAEYRAGTFYNPIVVNKKSESQVLWFGIIMSIGLIIFIYLILQFIVPKIQKVVFDRKYVVQYRPNMSISGVIVDNTCYYCKAPFEEGDKVVAKCSHTMHKQCWDENGYHCPEYGSNCKHGSHYYNQDNLLDPDNASFHMIWVLCGTVASVLSWILLSISQSSFFFIDILKTVVLKMVGIQKDTPEAADFVAKYIDSLDIFPSFGLFIGILLTLIISFLTIHKRTWYKMAGEAVLRSLIAGVSGYLFFLIFCIITIIIDNEDLSIFIDWIPWALSGISIALCSSIRTNIIPKRYWMYSITGIGFLTMFIWEFVIARIGIDYRGWQLLNYIIFSVGIALTIAHAAPVSERYFLHVRGAIKDMDIAIYKWFSANSNKIATIGRSVDCDLMMSWDVNGDIAPVQAKLSKKGHKVYITPIEDGVYSKGKMLTVGKPFRLDHGKAITIGNTEMVFEEKDK